MNLSPTQPKVEFLENMASSLFDIPQHHIRGILKPTYEP